MEFYLEERVFCVGRSSFRSLLEDLEGVSLSQEEDRWSWNLEECGIFSMKSAYKKLDGLMSSEVLWGEEEKGVFKSLWKSPAPSKMIAFSWKILLNHIPTKDNLSLRNILSPEVSRSCLLCDEREESAIHLFLHCKVASGVWLEVIRWFGSSFIMPPNIFIHWECWSGIHRNKKIRRGL